MKQYLNLLEKILNEGVEKESGRANMPNTFGISQGLIQMDMNDGFPLLTTKKMYWKGIVHELLWFLRGETNIKYLVDNNVNIWNGDAYRWYLKYHKECTDGTVGHMTQEEFYISIKSSPDEGSLSNWFSGSDYCLGDLGKVYGYQWRNQNGVDQVKEVIDGLQTNPYSRYHVIDGWNKADFKEMALPPCHLLYQFICRPLSHEEKIQWVMSNTDVEMENLYIYEETLKDSTPKYYLDLNMYQRSCDTLLGVPFNIASMSLLLHIFAKTCNMIPGVSNWIGGDTHIYMDHIPMVQEQLTREPYDLCKLVIKKDLKSLDDILQLTIDDFEIQDYKSHDAIKAELFTGIKK